MIEQNKVAVITGANRGTGKAIAISLAKSGFHTALVGRSTEGLEKVKSLCSEHGAKSEYFEFDLTGSTSFDDLKELVIKSFGQVDVLVNNAGSGGSGKIQSVSAEKIDTCLQTNILGLMHITRVFSPEIIKSTCGAVINIASIASRITYSGGAAYSSSKHAVLGFSGCIYEDLREDGVKVCALLPGFVDTEMVDSKNMNREKMISPDDVAEAVSYVLNSSSRVCPTEIVMRPQRSPYK
jgi:short-subunit dehydrogenase